MSNNLDSVEHELSVEELLREIIDRLDILILHNESITDEIYTEEDIE